MLYKKRERKNVLCRALVKEQDFLLEELGKEWDEIQRGAKREELVRRAKEVGFAMAKTILVLAAIGGILTVAVVAPNIFAAIGKITGRRGFFNQRQFREAVSSLKKKNLITVGTQTGGITVIPTSKGMERVLVISYKRLKIRPQKKWDGVWRIVTFDIPNRHKWGREAFRDKLKNMGFYPLQESVFISPYPCQQEIESLASIFFLKNYIRFIEAHRLDDDSDVREYFFR